MPLQRWMVSTLGVAVLTLGLGGAANAQPRGEPRHPGAQSHAKVHGHPHGPQWKHGHRPPPPVVHRYRGAGPQHRWVQGSRLPPHYRSSRYVVRDWHRHRLHRPPPGYHWVQYGRDYMLVAIASGVIAQLLIHGAY